MAHQKTIECVKKAESLIEEGSTDSLRYASIQLRMGIEYLFYELIPFYQDELPDDIVVKKWQPKEILDALIECDPDVDKDARISIGSYDANGSELPPFMTLETKAPNKKILKQHYHRLGSYLHAPVNLIEPDLEKWKSDLNKVVESLQEFKSHQTLMNVRSLVQIPCLCGRVIKRNRRGIEVAGYVQCPNPECNAIFDVSLGDDKTSYQLRQTSYSCPSCKTENFIPVHKITDGVKITCVECSKSIVARSGFVIHLLDESSQ